jgi:hypothetical protein
MQFVLTKSIPLFLMKYTLFVGQKPRLPQLSMIFPSSKAVKHDKTSQNIVKPIVFPWFFLGFNHFKSHHGMTGDLFSGVCGVAGPLVRRLAERLALWAPAIAGAVNRWWLIFDS